MESIIRINDDLMIGDEPTELMLHHLSVCGVRSVIDLRPFEETEDGDNDEADIARAVGMGYRHVPVAPDDPSEERVSELRAAFDELRKPIFVHALSDTDAKALERFIRTSCTPG